MYSVLKKTNNHKNSDKNVTRVKKFIVLVERYEPQVSKRPAMSFTRNFIMVS